MRNKTATVYAPVGAAGTLAQQTQSKRTTNAREMHMNRDEQRYTDPPDLVSMAQQMSFNPHVSVGAIRGHPRAMARRRSGPPGPVWPVPQGQRSKRDGTAASHANRSYAAEVKRWLD